MMKVQSSKVRDLFAREKKRVHGGSRASGQRAHDEPQGHEVKGAGHQVGRR